MLESCYKLLGLDMSATIDDVKKRYRELAKIYHSNKTSGNKELEEELKKITAAYRIIMLNMRDKCLEYEVKFEFKDEEIYNMPNEKIIVLIENINQNITKISFGIEKFNKSLISSYDLASLFDLQAKIITTKYKQALENLHTQKSVEKFQKWFLYYLIPKWKKNFEEKYLVKEQMLMETWENNVDSLADKVNYWTQKMKIARRDIDKLQQIRSDLYSKRSKLNQELKKRKQKKK